MVRGILVKLGPLQNCKANHKLKTKTGTVFLDTSNINKIDGFLRKEMVVEGSRVYDGCTYIKADSVSIIK